MTWWISAVFMLLTWGVMLIGVFGQCGLDGDIYNIGELSILDIRLLKFRTDNSQPSATSPPISPSATGSSGSSTHSS